MDNLESTFCNLTAKSCKPCEGGVPPLAQAEIDHLLQGLTGWTQAGNELVKTFAFKNYYETMAFVNATAWISHRENHHPDLEVGYRNASCAIRRTPSAAYPRTTSSARRKSMLFLPATIQPRNSAGSVVYVPTPGTRSETKR